MMIRKSVIDGDNGADDDDDDNDDDDDDDRDLKSTTTTAVKTSRKKWICVFSNFIASIWNRSIRQMQATFPGVEFLKALSMCK